MLTPAASFALVVLLLNLVEVEGASSQIQVLIPHNLTRTDGYDHLQARFGFPSYSGSVQQDVYYAGGQLCNPIVSTEAAVTSKKGHSRRLLGGEEMPIPPFLLMVDRGDCTFVRKVRYAQQAGAMGVIIADNTCLCRAGDTCTPNQPNEPCEVMPPIMADDGSGSDVTIPSFLMFKEDADPIRDLLLQNVTVRMEMKWGASIPPNQIPVDYNLFTLTFSEDTKGMKSRAFLEQFLVAARALGKHAKFTPHMYITDGIRAGCRSPEGGGNQCGNLCTNNGRYCAVPEQDADDEGISGADVVQESLRRACIWNIYGSMDGIGEEWWKYVQYFLSHCQGDNFFNTSDYCIEEAYNHSGVGKNSVDSCMVDSGGLEGDVPNFVLESQLVEQRAFGAVISPSLFINYLPLQGELDFANVFQQICAGFMNGTQPDVCMECVDCLSGVFECVAEGECTTVAISVDGNVAEGETIDDEKNSGVPPLFGWGALSLLVMVALLVVDILC